MLITVIFLMIEFILKKVTLGETNPTIKHWNMPQMPKRMSIEDSPYWNEIDQFKYYEKSNEKMSENNKRRVVSFLLCYFVDRPTVPHNRVQYKVNRHHFHCISIVKPFLYTLLITHIDNDVIIIVIIIIIIYYLLLIIFIIINITNKWSRLQF